MKFRHHKFITRDSYIKNTLTRMKDSTRARIETIIQREIGVTSRQAKNVKVKIAEVKKTVFTPHPFVVKEISFPYSYYPSRFQSNYAATELRLEIDNYLRAFTEEDTP